MMLRLRRPYLVLLLACAGTIAVFELTPQPFLWTLLLWTVATMIIAFRARPAWLKAALVNAAAVLLALGAYEAYLWLRAQQADPTRFAGSYTTGYFDGDDLLGYGPAKSQNVIAEKYFGDELIYRVTYTIGANGLRVSPPMDEAESGCVLFFGGSVTFGEGVEDHQAMPYRVGELTGKRYRIYNFGFHGYGPHQMLAALERGRVEEIVDCGPAYVIYQAIVPHVERVSGLASWDSHGPRYVLAPEGGVRLAGHFDDPEVNPRWKQWLGRWLTYDTLFGSRRAVRAEEIELYAEVVDAARNFVERGYPGSEFHVLLWDDKWVASHDEVLAALQRKELRLHRMTDILPAYRDDKARYELHEHDHHPNAATQNAIAGYVVRHILPPVE